MAAGRSRGHHARVSTRGRYQGLESSLTSPQDSLWQQGLEQEGKQNEPWREIGFCSQKHRGGERIPESEAEVKAEGWPYLGRASSQSGDGGGGDW